MPFHTDYSRRTKHVTWNYEAEFAGGRLVFATSNEMPGRPAGAACTHTLNIVHGVTAMGFGVGYSLFLFLCDTRGDTPDVLNKVCLEDFHHLVAPTLAQLPYLEASVEVLRGTSDDRLAAAVDGMPAF